MKHISIEGMDGVGKSTICKIISEKMNFKFIEKPFHLVFDFIKSEEEKILFYQKIAKKINSIENRDITSLFYFLGSMIMYYYNEKTNIVTDRHLCSNYAWSYNDKNNDIYELANSKIKQPDLTVILYASQETIKKRLLKRNTNDNDIKKITNSEHIYERMIDFCKKFNYKYIVVDTNKLSPEEIFQVIRKELENEY